MNDSRTLNSVKNFSISLIIQIIHLLCTFVSRTLFIRYLNIDYNGVNGVFGNILLLLSLAELGVGSVIVYSMYKPVSIGDRTKICALLNLYKKAYRVIAVIISSVGLLCVPFLKYLISEAPNIKENLTAVYLLFLADTISSYLFAYRKSIFTAYQKEYVVIVIHQVVTIVQMIFQIALLALSHNYYLYLFTQITFTLLSNLFIHLYAAKKFPYIRNNTYKLEKSESKKVFFDIKSMFYYKIGSAILNGTDNIIIMKLFGITVVGICSNYILIITTFESIISKALNTIVASIGNLNAGQDNKQKIEIFNELYLLTFCIYGFCTIELALLLSDFVEIWFQGKYNLPNFTVYCLAASFFVFGFNFTPSNFRLTMGYFKEGKFAPIVAAVLNVILSVYLGMKIGVSGIFLATAVSRLVTFGVIDPYLSLKKGLSYPLWKFYLKSVFYVFVLLATSFVCFYLTKDIVISNIGMFILKGMIIAVECIALFVLFFFNTREFKSLFKRFIFLRGCK